MHEFVKGPPRASAYGRWAAQWGDLTIYAGETREEAERAVLDDLSERLDDGRLDPAFVEHGSLWVYRDVLWRSPTAAEIRYDLACCGPRPDDDPLWILDSYGERHLMRVSVGLPTTDYDGYALEAL